MAPRRWRDYCLRLPGRVETGAMMKKLLALLGLAGLALLTGVECAGGRG